MAHLASSEGVQRSRRWPRVPLGEVFATWLLAAFLIIAGFVTYTRIDPARLYADVWRHGLAGGLSRVVMAANFPLALIAIAVVLVVLDDLPARAWWLAGPSIAVCAVAAYPGVVDQHDMDVRWVNAIPAVGVALALVLTAVARAGAGHGFASRRWLDVARVVVAGVVLLVSIPWIVGQLGLYLPEGIYLVQRRVAESNGALTPAVHLGFHHGFGGTLFVLSALLLSRPALRMGRRATVTMLYVSLMFGYGIVNLAQDFWGEQVVKRGWTDLQIPSAIAPRMAPIWLVVLAIAAVSALLLRHETARDGRAADRGGELPPQHHDGRRRHDPGGRSRHHDLADG